RRDASPVRFGRRRKWQWVDRAARAADDVRRHAAGRAARRQWFRGERGDPPGSAGSDVMEAGMTDGGAVAGGSGAESGSVVAVQATADGDPRAPRVVIADDQPMMRTAF